MRNLHVTEPHGSPKCPQRTAETADVTMLGRQREHCRNKWGEGSVKESVASVWGETDGYNPTCDFTDHCFFTVIMLKRKQERKEKTQKEQWQGETEFSKRSDEDWKSERGRKEWEVDKGKKYLDLRQGHSLNANIKSGRNLLQILQKHLKLSVKFELISNSPVVCQKSWKYKGG